MINDNKTQGTWKIHYLGNKIIEHKTQSEWKIQLTMEIKFISFKPYSDETRTITISDDVNIMKGSETEEVIKELFESLFKRYEKN